MRFILRNPLLTDISISNLRLCCRYIKEEKKEGDAAPVVDEETKGEELAAEFEAETTEIKQLPSQE